MSFSLGATSTAAAPGTGFSFGATSTAAAPGTGFSFGTGATTTATPSLGFGTGATAAPTSGFGFGGNTPANPTSTAAAPSTGFGFGSTAPKATSSAAPSGTGFGFGNTLASKPAVSGFGFGQSSAAATTSTGLGTTPAFGTATTALGTAPSFGTGSTVSTTTSASGFGLGGMPASTAAVAPVGFGVSTSVQSASGVAPSSEAKPLKEQNVPNELVQMVESFKSWVKDERAVATEISHSSDRQHKKVADAIDALAKNLKALSVDMNSTRHNLDCLKIELSEELQNAELAQRTKEMAPTLQFENTAPQEYFGRLVAMFQSKMHIFARQIDDIERALEHAKNGYADINTETLIMALQKQQATLTNLAGRLQVLHESVKKEASWRLSNQQMSNTSLKSIFPATAKRSDGNSGRQLSSRVGPSPFVGVDNSLNVARASLVSSVQPNSATNLMSPGIGSINQGSSFGSNTPLAFGNNATNSFFGQDQMGKRSKV